MESNKSAKEDDWKSEIAYLVDKYSSVKVLNYH